MFQTCDLKKYIGNYPLSNYLPDIISQSLATAVMYFGNQHIRRFAGGREIKTSKMPGVIPSLEEFAGVGIGALMATGKNAVVGRRTGNQIFNLSPTNRLHDKTIHSQLGPLYLFTGRTGFTLLKYVVISDCFLMRGEWRGVVWGWCGSGMWPVCMS